MRQSFHLSFLLASIAAMPGCFLFNPNTDPPEQVARCEGPSIAGDPSPNTRQVWLGDGLYSNFKPYEEGGRVHSVTGGQGSTMITPAVRVAAAASDTAEMCLYLHLETRYVKGAGGAGGSAGSGTGAAGGGMGGSENNEPELEVVSQDAKLSLQNGFLYTEGPLYNPLNSFGDYDGLELSLLVRGSDFSGTQTVTVRTR